MDGDILMDNETLALQEHAINGGPLTSRTAVLPKGNVHLWPNGQVPYEFDNTFGKQEHLLASSSKNKNKNKNNNNNNDNNSNK